MPVAVRMGNAIFPERFARSADIGSSLVCANWSVIKMADKHPANQPEETTVLYQNIKAICDERNISIAKIAKNAGVSESTIANWKKERSWMRSLPAVSKSLGISIDSLFNANCNETFVNQIMHILEGVTLDEKSTKIIIKLILAITE